jgi:arsenite methyltransferase
MHVLHGERTEMKLNETHLKVQEKYGQAARNAGSGCCGGTSDSGCGCGCDDPITGNLYTEEEKASLPSDAVNISLGCGNPAALATLSPGEVVLDLGSGGGIDVLLSARRVGPTGYVYGLDMTDEMLAIAEKNKAESGLTNVEFLRGNIEEIPLPDATVDVIISNCVINLASDKGAVLREAYRVLKPGGRFAVSDVVVEGEMPEAVRKDIEAYVGCVAGALEVNEYAALLRAAGFEGVSLEPTRRYSVGDIPSQAIEELTDEEKLTFDGRVMSAFVRATKPV